MWHFGWLAFYVRRIAQLLVFDDIQCFGMRLSYTHCQGQLRYAAAMSSEAFGEYTGFSYGDIVPCG